MSCEQHAAITSSYQFNKNVITKRSDSSCALACQNQRSICFWLHFSLVLSFVQAKERTSSLYQDKEKKGTKKYSLLI